MKTNLGFNLKQIRIKKNLSQEGFVNFLFEEYDFDLSRPALGAYEEGRGHPTVKNLIRLAKIFKVTIDDLLFKKL